MGFETAYGSLRVEDFRFLVGKGLYTDDFKPKNTAYLGIVRSPYAHARIKSIDYSQVENASDLLSFLDGKGLLEERVAPLWETPGQRPTKRYQLAIDRTRYVGEGIAAFVTRDRYAVEDIADRIQVEYEELPVVDSIEDSKQSKSLVYDDWKDNVARVVESKRGDVQSAFSSARHMTKARIGIKRQASVAIEPRSLIATYDKDKGLYKIHASIQSSHFVQVAVSTELKVPQSNIHVIVNDVGGGFGGKGSVSYPEFSLACIFARRTGLAIKWTSTRTEDLLETSQGRDQFCDIELACDENYKITALRARIEVDVGVSGRLIKIVNNTVNLLPGVYKIANIDIQGVCYVTNKTPTGPVRGNGRPEAAFFIERAIDIAAQELGIDPAEFRQRNLIQPKDFPYATGTAFTYDSGNYPFILNTLLKSAGYEDLERSKRAWNAAAHGTDKTEFAGLGLAVVVEDTGAELWETGHIVITPPDGKVIIYTGSSPHGQGQETTLAELCARELGLSRSRISVVWGDTEAIPSGVGTFGSRSIVAGGSAVIKASRELKKQILAAAAELYHERPEKICIQNDSIIVTSAPDTNTRKVESFSNFLKRVGIGFEAFAEFRLDSLTFASGAHLCALVVDSETFRTRITKYIVVDDCGKVINKMIVDGQIQGGVLHGVGNAILEELVYGDNGQPLATNLLGYTIPTSLDSPDVEVISVETPSILSLSGAKGVGESGTIGALPAVFNALNDALLAFSKTRLDSAPATPNAIYTALRQT